MPTSAKPVRTFKGLNTVDDPLRLSLDWALQADNVDITSKGSLSRCAGFARRTTNALISGAYATKDMQRLYVIDAGELRQVHPDFTYTVLKTGLSPGSYYFEEINGVIYFSNGSTYGVIETDGWRPWGVPTPGAPTLTMGSGDLPQGVYQVVCTLVDDRGMESGNSDIAVIEGSGRVLISDIDQVAGYTTNVYIAPCNETVFYLLPGGTSYDVGSVLGEEIQHWNTNTPQGKLPTHFKGQLYLADWYPELDATHIWCSLPLRYHHFDFGSEGTAVPGEVRLLKATDDALIIGTDRAIFASDGEKLTQLADYGVVPGWHAALLDGKLYFWTLRGLCQALPFKNMMEDTVSVAPGTSAGGAVVESGGLRRYVVALHKGGEAYNRR